MEAGQVEQLLLHDVEVSTESKRRAEVVGCVNVDCTLIAVCATAV